MTAKTILAATVACLALAACSGGSQSAPESAVSPDASSQAADAAVKPNEIPAAMQGRWGLAAADCAPAAGDATGLLEIGPMNLKLGASIARLMAVGEDTKTHIKATFAWSGDGSDRNDEVALDLGDDGKALVMTRSALDADAKPVTYGRCQ